MFKKLIFVLVAVTIITTACSPKVVSTPILTIPTTEPTVEIYGLPVPTVVPVEPEDIAAFKRTVYTNPAELDEKIITLLRYEVLTDDNIQLTASIDGREVNFMVNSFVFHSVIVRDGVTFRDWDKDVFPYEWGYHSDDPTGAGDFPEGLTGIAYYDKSPYSYSSFDMIEIVPIVVPTERDKRIIAYYEAIPKRRMEMMTFLSAYAEKWETYLDPIEEKIPGKLCSEIFWRYYSWGYNADELESIMRLCQIDWEPVSLAGITSMDSLSSGMSEERWYDQIFFSYSSYISIPAEYRQISGVLCDHDYDVMVAGHNAYIQATDEEWEADGGFIMTGGLTIEIYKYGNVIHVPYGGYVLVLNRVTGAEPITHAQSFQLYSVCSK